MAVRHFEASGEKAFGGEVLADVDGGTIVRVTCGARKPPSTHWFRSAGVAS